MGKPRLTIAGVFGRLSYYDCIAVTGSKSHNFPSSARMLEGEPFVLTVLNVSLWM